MNNLNSREKEMVQDEKSKQQAFQEMNIGVVGSGISGLSAAYSLALAGHSVTLLEKDSRFGGHTFTYAQDDEDKYPVDLGFQVYNLTNYPYLTEWLKTLEIETEPSDMSFAFSIDEGRLEWASNKNGLSAIFAQKKNLVNPEYISMLREAMRFGKEAEDVLSTEESKRLKYANMSLGQYLKENKYSESFRQLYLLPMTAAVWSVPNKLMLDFPVVTFIQFWKNHHLLNPLGDRPNWRVCKYRSQDYVQKVISEMKRMENVSVVLEADIVSLKQKQNGEKNSLFELTDGKGRNFSFEHVVFACHSNQALNILTHSASTSEVCQEEIHLLENIKYQKNDVYLHSDERLLPKLKSTWSSWNVLDKSNDSTDGGISERNICVSYWLNHLQNLPKEAPLKICTLNPIYEIDQKKIIAKFVLEHPIFDLEMLKARDAFNDLQKKKLNGTSSLHSNLWFCGAWLGNGFHEDGISSAVRVCNVLLEGAYPRWIKAVQPERLQVSTPSPVLSRKDLLFYKLFKYILKQGVKHGYLKIVLPNGVEDEFGRATIQEAKTRREPTAILYVNDLSIFLRLIRDSDVGLGEAFMEGLCDVSFYNTKFNNSCANSETFNKNKLNYCSESDDLVGLLKILVLNSKELTGILDSYTGNSVLNMVGAGMYKFGNMLLSLQHQLKKNTVMGSRRNIEAHYDLGNDMYELFLDNTMTYSSGIHFASDSDRENQKISYGLKESQTKKLDAIISQLELKASDFVLEIGCGWGSFAIQAAKTSQCKVVGITISVEQLEYAKKQVKAEGLEKNVFLCICDYRKLGSNSVNVLTAAMEEMEGVSDPEYVAFVQEVNKRLTSPGSFEKVASIEMIEAVGHEHLPEYFQVINKMLKPENSEGKSKACIQAISLANQRYMDYMKTSDFIRRHIFPGGHLVCLDAVKWATQNTDLAMDKTMDIGKDYAVTLNMWKNNFVRNKERILSLGYPESFIRKWVFYFAYCEAGFELGHILNYQILFEKCPAKHARQVQKELGNTTRLKFDEAVPDPKETRDVESITKDPYNLPLISTLIPALFWFVALLVNSRALQLISTIAVFSVFITSLLTSTLARTYFSPPKQLIGETKRRSWMKFYLDAHFAVLVNVSVLTSFVLKEVSQPKAMMQLPYLATFDSFLVLSVLLFASFGKLAAANARSLKESIPYFLHSSVFTMVIFFALQQESALSRTSFIIAMLHGIGEVHTVLRGIRKLSEIEGETQQTSSALGKIQRLEGFMIFGARLFPTWAYVLYNHGLSLFSIGNLSFATPTSDGWLFFACATLLLSDLMISLGAFLELYVEYENGFNTDELIKQKRFKKSREELIKNMTQTTMKQGEQSSETSKITSLYAGYVFHSRRKMGTVSPGANTFKYRVWMAFIDLDEVQQGTAFKNDWFISVNRFNFLSFNREDYYGAETGEDLATCIRKLVKRNVDIDVDGPVRLLTNLRCFGYIFNSLSLYYCYNKDEELMACVLELTNTPWLYKRCYVIKNYPNAQHPNKFYCRFEKDFHVSPFLDVFYDYEWIFEAPALGLENPIIKATSTSYRRKVPEGIDPQSDTYSWEHTVGDAPTIYKTCKLEEDNGLLREDDSVPKAFVAKFDLKRTDSNLSCFLWHPFMTLTAAWYIHYQAYVVMVRKKCAFQVTPSNQRLVGVADLLFNGFIFLVAIAWDILTWLVLDPLKAAVGALQTKGAANK